MFDQLKNMKNLAGLMGNMGELKQKFEQLQEEMRRIEVEADAGAGAVRVTANGRMEILRVQIDKAMLATFIGEGDETDKELVEQLIAGATDAALQKAQEAVREHMAELTGGLNLPGMEGLLGNL